MSFDFDEQEIRDALAAGWDDNGWDGDGPIRALLGFLDAERARVEALRGPRDERIEAMRKRARALVEKDPVQALTNVATALAVFEIEERFTKLEETLVAMARAEGRTRSAEAALLEAADLVRTMRGAS